MLAFQTPSVGFYKVPIDRIVVMPSTVTTPMTKYRVNWRSVVPEKVV